MNSNPYNLPDLPAPGETVAVPNQTLLDMDNSDDTCEQLEELVENGMQPSPEPGEGYAALAHDIVNDQDNEINDY